MSTKEAGVAVIERGGLRLGTSADAGKLCITSRSPDGIPGDLYRFYIRELHAPGPYQVRDPVTQKMVAARDEQGRELFDLDAVATWNASRPGPGARRPDQPVKWTELRHELMSGAADGKLRMRTDGRAYLGDEQLRARKAQRLSELVTAGLLTTPTAPGRRYTLTRAGRRWLEENAGHVAATT